MQSVCFSLTVAGVQKLVYLLIKKESMHVLYNLWGDCVAVIEQVHWLGCLLCCNTILISSNLQQLEILLDVFIVT